MGSDAHRSKHLILVGLPGSGKTSVGAAVARTLDWDFFDVDRVIEEKFGATIVQLWDTHGEEFFRRQERELVEELVNRSEPGVISPGGGWAAQTGVLDKLSDDVVTIYLETDPDIAVVRTVSSGDRPMLDKTAEDRGAVMKRLFINRRPSYERCILRSHTDGRTAEDVAQEVVSLARTFLR